MGGGGPPARKNDAARRCCFVECRTAGYSDRLGNTEDSAVELMRKVLGDYRNSLSELGKTTIDELCRYK